MKRKKDLNDLFLVLLYNAAIAYQTIVYGYELIFTIINTIIMLLLWNKYFEYNKTVYEFMEELKNKGDKNR